MSVQDYLKNLKDAQLRSWEEGKEILERPVAENREMTAEEQEHYERTSQAYDDFEEKIRSFQDRAQREAEADRARGEYENIVRPEVTDRRDRSDEQRLNAFLRGDPEIRALEVDISGVAREKRALRAGMSGEEFRVLQEDVAGAGGATVPTTFARQLYDFLEVYSGVRQTNATILTTSSGESYTFPKATLHSTAVLVGEGTAITAHDSAFSTVVLHAWKYANLVQLSTELISDSMVDIIGFVAKDSARAIARVTDTAYVSGTGSSQPQGFVPVLGTGATAQTGATGLPSFSNLVDLVYSVNQEYRNDGAQFVMKDATAGAIRKIVDSQNRPLWEPSYQVGQPGRILGYPVVTDPNMNALSTAASQRPIVFGDLSPFYIRDVGAVRFERSDDYAFNTDLVTWRVIFRTDSNLLDLTGCAKVLLEPTT